MNVRLSVIPATALCFLLAGCSGGGDDNPPPNPTPPLPIVGDQTPDGSGTPVSLGEPQRNSIENLFGRVSFRYKFNGATNTYTTNSAVFASASEVAPLTGGERTVVTSLTFTDGSDGDLACSEVREQFADFLCVAYADDDSKREVFVFTMNGQFTGSGDYEFCNAAELTNGPCSAGLSDPDGVVDVTVTRDTILAKTGETMNGLPISRAESFDYKLADELEFGSASPVSGKEIHSKDSLDELVAEIENRARADYQSVADVKD